MPDQKKNFYNEIKGENIHIIDIDAKIPKKISKQILVAC